MTKLKMENIQKGYAEVYFPDSGKAAGYVHTEEFVVFTDFENDIIHRTERWVPYAWMGGGSVLEALGSSPGFSKVGRTTGYSKRKHALRALEEYWEENR